MSAHGDAGLTTPRRHKYGDDIGLPNNVHKNLAAAGGERSGLIVSDCFGLDPSVGARIQRVPEF